MPIGVSNFQILDPNQANPLGYGLQQGLAMRLNALQAQKAQNELPYVAKLQEQQLQKAIYENMIQKPYAEQAPQFAGAALQKARAEPGEILARTGLYGEQARVQAEEAAKMRYLRTTGQYDPAMIQLTRNLPQFIQGMQALYAQQNGANGVAPTASSAAVASSAAMPQQNIPESTPQLSLAAPTPASRMQQLVQQAMVAARGQGFDQPNPQRVSGEGLPESTPQLSLAMPQAQNPMERILQSVMQQNHQAGIANIPEMQAQPQAQPQVPPEVLQQALQQQQAPQAAQSQQGQNSLDNKIPGTDITMKQAINAVISKELGLPIATPPDPETVRWHNAQLAQNDQRIKQADMRLQAAAYKSLPPEAKAADIARAAPIVGDYTTAARELEAGKSVEQIALENGYTKDNMPPAAPPPGKTVINQNQQGNIARAAFNAVHEKIQKDLNTYPETAAKWSIGAIKDRLQGKNDEQIGRFLGAQFVNTEVNALINKGANVNVGLGVLTMADRKGYAEGKFPGFLKNKKIMDSMRNTIYEYSQDIRNSENIALNRIYAMQNPTAFGGSPQAAAPGSQAAPAPQNTAMDAVNREMAELDAEILSRNQQMGAK